MKCIMKGMEEDVCEVVCNVRCWEEEVNVVVVKFCEELVMIKVRLNLMIEVGEGKLNYASIRDA